MRVHLGGHLSWYDAQRRAWLDLAQPAPVRLVDLADRLGLPHGEIAITVLNGRAVDPATTAAAGEDRVEFYSPLGGG